MFRERRGKVVVNKGLQWRLVWSVTWPPTVIVCVVMGLLFAFVNRLQVALADVGAELLDYVPFLFDTSIFVFLALILHVLLALKASHRVAGAAYAIEKALQGFKGGDRSVRARIRKGDLLTQLNAEINSFLEWVEEDTRAPVTKPASPPGTPSPAPPVAATPDRPASAGEITPGRSS